ncbi:glycosyltransferase family 2 protein [Marivita hallyeonensis]|uniref:Glycosyl transferase family 2 n=1 Tax=Marivita hallyeonensis TaxID=996342 RepID=A0A1M5RGQ1_9RHOB|nr:glycosyltransferase family 2 protein [Marivita hallyeonensis]SHH25368.1 Glycosyl transferase family 2 [Marivita hallyeonensis]
MSSKKAPPNPAYPQGMTGILNQMNARRAPLTFAQGEALPPLDCDLDALSKKKVKVPSRDAKQQSEHARKDLEISKELKGQNALLHLNALLIAHLRKNNQPPHAADLFVRLWAEQSQRLLREMDLRWKVSSLTTFGDHGKTPTQRSTGLALSTLFGTMKLYESERLYSGRDPERPFTLGGRSKAPLPLDMNGFSLTNGGLDVNMIGRLWEEADRDDVIRPLAHDMLQRLIDDPRTVFRRLHRLRARKLRRLEQSGIDDSRAETLLPVPKDVLAKTHIPPSWGLVCTTNAPLLDVARFVAYHIDLGARRIYLFLDTPDTDVIALLGENPKVRLTVCDAAYWRQLGKDRPDTHQVRQSFNATHALRQAEGDVDWLGHIDIDEFILSDKKLSTTLKSVADDAAAIRLFPAEALASKVPGAMPTHFKLRPASDNAAQALHDAYPTFGSYLRGGFLSHTAGKIFVRTGLGEVRLKIHRVRFHGQDVSNVAQVENVHVGHLHAPDWESFMAKLAFRREKGSYRIQPDEPMKSVGRLLSWLHEEEGDEGLRMFFDEMCLDSSDLRARLKRNDLLLTPQFDPDAALERVFGVRLAG